MYDQAVREQVGGAMASYLAQNPLPDEEFVYKRIGEEGRDIVKALRGQVESTSPSTTIWKAVGSRPTDLFRRIAAGAPVPDGLPRVARASGAAGVSNWSIPAKR